MICFILLVNEKRTKTGTTTSVVDVKQLLPSSNVQMKLHANLRAPWLYHPQRQTDRQTAVITDAAADAADAAMIQACCRPAGV